MGSREQQGGGVVAAHVGGDSQGRPGGLIRALRVLAYGAFGVVSSCLVVAAMRTARLPDADGYLASLPLVGELPARHDYANPPEALPPPLVANGLTLRRTPACMDLELLSGHGALTLHDSLNCDRVIVRRDQTRDLWILESKDVPFRRVWAYRPPSTESIPMWPSNDLRETLAPPHLWTLLALVAWVAAALGLLVAGRKARRIERGAVGSAGRHKGDGWIELDAGGPPAHSAVVRGLPIGARVLCVREGPVMHVRLKGQGYRDGAGWTPKEVLEGTKETFGAQAAYARARGYAFALGSLAVGGTPLVVEAIARWW